MFTIYRINVGGRKHDRYFHSCKKAKSALLEDVETMYGKYPLIRERNEFNADKGFYVYEKVYQLDNEEVTLSLIDGEFEDD